jgi:isopenicillin-N epimerase
LRELPRVKILNSEDPAQSWVIGFMSVANIDAPALSKYLWNKHRVWTVAIVTPGEHQGLRMTPNVYTTLEELGTFTIATMKIIKKGRPRLNS